MRHHREKMIRIEPFLPEDYFESSSLKSAVWQYLIDHAKPTNGYFKIFLFLKDEEEFWRRVQARKDGRYRRHDLLKMRHKLATEEWHSRTLKESYKRIMKSKVRTFIYNLLIK